MTLAERFQAAAALHQQGKLEEARQAYEDILRVQTDHLDALHLLGMIELQNGRFESGVQLIRRAVAGNANVAAYHNNLGFGLSALRRCGEAVGHFDQAIALKPDYVEAYFNRGNALLELKRRDEAVASYDKAIALKPGLAEAYCKRGNALYHLRRLDEALASAERAIGLKADYAEAHVNRGLALKELKRLDEALASYDKAIALAPGLAAAFTNRGNVLKDLDRLDEAAASFDKAIELEPAIAETYSNQGLLLVDLARFKEALAGYDKAIALKPEYADAHANKSLCLLLLGRFEEGWREYEWRTKRSDTMVQQTYPALPVRSLRGDENIAGKTVLVRAEQGLGDTIQFCRYLKLLEARGARVTVAVQARLRAIVGTLSPTINVAVGGEVLSAVDYHCPLASLPLAFGTMLESIPAEVPYLKVDPKRVERWRQRIGSEGLRVGIAWQGRPDGRIDAGRSFALSEFEEISRLDGVRLISLQKNFGSEQLAWLPAGMKVETLGEDYDAGPDAFLDTAAVMESLDLVITSDTAIAHLAGALGRPVWVALKWVPDWRWLLERADSPWYPTMRLFRQPSRGDWKGVFRAMKDELGGSAGRTTVASTPSAPSVPVSWGELIDKITILEIKARKLSEASALANVRRELALLSATAGSHFAAGDLLRLKGDLAAVNEALWEIEDRIRGKEAARQFDEEFISLARSVYRQNDRRAAIKREINLLLASELVEEKSYKAY
jgi:tetratricopeptide (TPR) repeat protein